jgi:hypothetical protein
LSPRPQRPSIPTDQAFSKAFTAQTEQGALLRKAVVILKASMFVPLVIDGADQFEDIVTLVEASEPKPGKRGPYKKRIAA